MNAGITVDIRTIFLIQVFVNLVIGLAMWLTTRGRYQYKLGYFVGLFLSQAVIQLLLFFRGILPDFVTIVIANTLLVSSYNLGYLGYCEFFHRRVNWWLVYPPVVVTFILFWVYLDNFSMRATLLALISMLQYGIQFFLVLSVKETAVQRSKPILLTGYGLTILLFIIRGAYLILVPGGFTNIFDSVWANSFTFFATIPTIILIAMGLLLMVSDRLLDENRELATRDSLTHIFNRRTFNDLAHRELARAERYNHYTSLLILDIDHFKQVNDTYGHPIGDEALIHLVQIIKKSVRMQDLYGRYGGEEFIILLAETPLSEAFEIAERLREKIENSSLHIQNHIIKMTVSIGIATARGEDKPTLEDLISGADEAMYAAKKAGRNCTRMMERLPIVVDPQFSI